MTGGPRAWGEVFVPLPACGGGELLAPRDVSSEESSPNESMRRASNVMCCAHGASHDARDGAGMPERLYSTYQVADLLGATPATVHEWLRKGWLPFIRMPGGPVRVSEEVLIHFLEQRGVDIEEVLAKAESCQGAYEGELSMLEPPVDDLGSLAEDLMENGQSIRQQAQETEQQEVDARADRPEPPGEDQPAEPTPAADEESPHPPAHPESDEKPPPLAASREEGQDSRTPEPETSQEFPAEKSRPSPEPAGPGQPHRQAEAIPPGRAETDPPGQQSSASRRPEDFIGRKSAQVFATPVDAAEQVAGRILDDAIARGATGVHLSPGLRGLSLRLRIDGVLREKESFRSRLPEDLVGALPARLRQMAGLSPAEGNTPRRGEIEYPTEAGPVKVHLLTVPGPRGEAIVLRIDRPVRAVSLDRLGMNLGGESILRDLLARQAGLILWVSPPGCDRSSALFSVASHVASPHRQVALIGKTGDPLPDGLLAMQVDTGRGFDRDRAIEAARCTDADVLIVGQADGLAGANELLEAAVEGTLVIAGLTDRNAPDALAGLVDVGIRPLPLAASLLGVVEQRTVRRLCPACRQVVQPGAEEALQLGFQPGEVTFPVSVSPGCADCAQTGLAGTIDLVSVRRIDEEIARLIRRGACGYELADALAGAAPDPLRAVALERARQGVTSLREIARVL